MQVQRFDPFTVLARMDREFDELVRRGWGGAREKGAAPHAMAGFVPAVEVVREDADVVVRVELPGIDVERDVAIDVDRGKLVISGERRDTREESGGGVLVRELRYGQFRREFALPVGVSPEQIEATYEGGLLDVRVRGVAQQQPSAVRVPIASGRTQQVTAAQADEGDATSSPGATG